MNIKKFIEEKALIIDSVIAKYIPRKYHKNSLLFKLLPPRYEYNLKALNKGIIEPLWEFLDRGGKRWRPAFFLLICDALGYDPGKVLDFAIIPEVIHNGTLIIDDIEDKSDFRRGKQCTYQLVGIDIATNLGTAMYYLPLLTLIKNTDISAEKARRIYEIYVEEMIKLSLGQATDIIWHKGLISKHEISEEQYLQMCVCKTGALARMAAKLAAILADADEQQVEKIGTFAEAIGVAFQIYDDILDLVGEEFAEKKGGLGKDITEGKITLMIINTLKEAESTDKKRLTEIIEAHTTDQQLKNEAIRIINKYNSIKYAKEFARNIINYSWEKVDNILPSSEAKENLRAFANYLVNRNI